MEKEQRQPEDAAMNDDQGAPVDGGGTDHDGVDEEGRLMPHNQE